MCARYAFPFLLIGLWLGVPAAMFATEQPSATQPSTVGSSGPSVEDLSAEWSRTVAALWEERAKPQPNPQRIVELQTKLRQLRLQLGAAGAKPVNVPVGVCPLGGPGLGLGFGRGPGYAAGMGVGRGPSAGWVPQGGGFGPGWGRGPGRMAGGWRGMGVGPNFIDQNRNGICDYYEFRRGW